MIIKKCKHKYNLNVKIETVDIQIEFLINLTSVNKSSALI